jgi:hypothetical protein
MPLNWSDVAAWIALPLSILALVQSSRHRSGDLLMEAQKLRTEIEETIRSLDGAPTALLKEWRAVLSVRGMLQSGAAIQKEQQALALEEKVEDLRKRLSEIPRSEGFLRRVRAEGILSRLNTVAVLANSIVEAVAEERAELDRNREDLRSRRR